MKAEDNPVTHSSGPERSDHVVSSTTGHQVASGPTNIRVYSKMKMSKLKTQHVGDSADESSLFKGLIFRMNGYQGSEMSDNELRRKIHEHGGAVT